MQLILIQPDQLHHGISALRGMDPDRDIVCMFEYREMFTNVMHHPQKIVLILSAMRQMMMSLGSKGIRTDYVKIGDPANTGTLTGELTRACRRHHPDRLVLTEPGEWRVRAEIDRWCRDVDTPVKIRDDDRFFCSRREFAAWAEGRKTFQMEHFYRWMRRRTGILMTGKTPDGGRWNFDADNRKSLPRDAVFPERIRWSPDAVTRDVMEYVARHFGDHFGDLEPFGWAVTSVDAGAALEHFIETCLASFGDYQDAMQSGQDLLFHSLLSPYINTGLLDLREVCDAVLTAWETGRAPINAVEGYIRQIIGWREFVRGIYWLKMPEYAATNALDAHRPLPAFYWSGDTDMNCLRQCIRATRRNAYAHHIQRLMVTGNFALLISARPSEVEKWYLAVYADAWDWVELPNTHGMVLFADGGMVGTKPYAASGAYINRMSDYCRECRYNPREKLGEGACPFNYLYWNFLMEKASVLASNPRMAMPYRNLAKMTPERRNRIESDARLFLKRLYRSKG